MLHKHAVTIRYNSAVQFISIPLCMLVNLLLLGKKRLSFSFQVLQAIPYLISCVWKGLQFEIRGERVPGDASCHGDGFVQRARALQRYGQLLDPGKGYVAVFS